MEIILAKMGEVVLKGLNRRSFEDRMLRSLRHRLGTVGSFKVYSAQSTVYVEPLSEDLNMERAFLITSKVFGLVSVSRAYSCEKNLEDFIQTAAEKLSAELGRAGSFKVETKRSDKRFPLKSPEVSREVGGALCALFPHLKVDVHTPDITVYVEIRDYSAYVHTNPIPGAGGLPIGSAGKATVLLSGGIDSPVAAYMMAKRGLELEAVHFYSYPYTSERARQKVLTLAGKLAAYCGRIVTYVVPFTKLQEVIRDNCPEEYSTIMMRRCMMRISERLAEASGCEALCTNADSACGSLMLSAHRISSVRTRSAIRSSISGILFQQEAGRARP